METVEELRSALLAERARAEAAEKEAARYRFIRSGGAYIEPQEDGSIYAGIETWKCYEDLRDLDMDLDEAIHAQEGEQ